MIRTALSRSAAGLSLGLVLLAGAAAAQTPAAGDTSVAVHLRGLTPGKGSVIVMLFDSDTAYDAGKATQTNKVDATGQAMDVSFSGVTPGRYAIKVFYDINSNGQYDQGTDSIGFSNHVDMSEVTHVPTFSETSFMVKPGANTQQITVQRVRS